MSLYILGKITAEERHHEILHKQLYEKANLINAGVAINNMDPEDAAVFEEFDPSDEKFYFSVHSSPEENDGTELWIEAYDLARSILRRSMGQEAMYIANTVENVAWPETYVAEMKTCRLARFLYDIAEMPYYQRLGITFIDGGVRTDFRGSAEECIEEILRQLLLPWDCSPNTLYIWDTPSGQMHMANGSH